MAKVMIEVQVNGLDQLDNLISKLKEVNSLADESTSKEIILSGSKNINL